MAQAMDLISESDSESDEEQEKEREEENEKKVMQQPFFFTKNPSKISIWS